MRRVFKFRPRQKETERYRVNEQIRIPRVVVIDENGQNLGELETFRALELAKQKELDLIEVSPNAHPPVCRIMDHGKFQYQKSKQLRASKANQKKVETKEVRISVRTEEHDRNFKKGQVEKFLSKGSKVKVEIVMKGREKAHADLARQILNEFVKNVTTPYKIEEDIKKTPYGLHLIIAPQ